MRVEISVVPRSLMVVLMVTPVVAAAPSNPKDLARQARIECAAGNFETGVRLLAELWVSTKDTTWIYNQARCYEQNARPAEAINSFREYLRVAKDITAEEKTDLERHLADCRDLQAEQEKKAASAVPAPVPTAPAPASTTLGQAPETSVASRAVAGAQSSTPAAGVANPVAVPVPAVPSNMPRAGSPGTTLMDISTQHPSNDSAGESRPIYKTWWFWTGAAAIVAAGTVTAILIAGRSSGPCDGASLACRGVR